ncbi:isochorismatase family cysteine hydrolase [Cupriavidus sp. 2MCAB6]|uniref:isochorismatase family cysteine hydrolase n=1 Tax=Cupriavidus sp. 2MCAB6 TaxID=3232981 RepID=UPI003F8EDB14
MRKNAYPKAITALLLVDPYNDFLSDEGKLNRPARAVADATGTVGNMRRVLAAVRAAGITVFYVPHHRATPDDFAGWKHLSPYMAGAHRVQPFAAGSWGGEWHPDFMPQPQDVMATEHFGSSGFANTDLDHQLRRRGMEHLIVIGMLANTCIETTAKFGAELGYHITLVKDATAAFSPEAMHAAHEINGPTYAHVILTTDELLPQLQAAG